MSLPAQLLDDDRIRRRATAAHAVTIAASLEHLRKAGRPDQLGVPFPHNPNPTSLRRWAEQLEAANSIDGTG